MENKLLMIIPHTMPNGDVAYSKIPTGYASDCLNMRETAHALEPALEPVGMPTIVSDSYLTPFFTFTHASGKETLLLYRGNTIYGLSTGSVDLKPRELVTLSGTPTGAVASGNIVAITTSQGINRVRYDETADCWSLIGDIPDYPALMFYATETAEFNAVSDQCQLEGDYVRTSEPLSEADVASLTREMSSLYTRIADDATGAGFYIQPVVARYRLFDRCGVMLYESAPVMVSSQSGFQCCDALTADVGIVDGCYRNVGSLRASATGFRLGLKTVDDERSPWRDLVASATVIVSPQLHPIDYGSQSSMRLENVDATKGLLRIYMPGTSYGMVPNVPRRMSLTRAVIANEASLACVVVQVNNPFDRLATGMVLDHGDNMEASKANAMLLRTLSKRNSATIDNSYSNLLLRAINIPHSFTAHTVLACGDLIAWGGITPLRYCGYPAPLLAVTTGKGRWYANVKVSMQGGKETVVWHGEGEDNAPLTFSPVLSYPLPDASSMTITVSYNDGSVKSGTFPLTPVAGMSMYIDSSFSPITLSDELDAYVIPAEKRSGETHPGTVVTSQLSSPFLITGALQLSQGDVTAIKSAVRSASSWDFASTHLYVFTTAGSYAVAVNSTRRAMTAHVIDGRGVYSNRAVTTTGDSVVAVADGDLVSFSGSKATTIAAATGYGMVGWNASFGELWCISSSGGVEVRSPTGMYRRDLAIADLYSSPSGKLFLATDDNLLDASIEQRSGRIPVLWRTRIGINELVLPKPMRNRRLSRPHIMTWLLVAEDVDVTLSLRGDEGVGYRSSMPLVKLHVRGSLNAPVPARIISPPRYYLTVEVQGEMSGDAQLRSIQLLLNK